MATKIIVSYDGSDNDRDALALARLFADAGASLELAYVRHALEAERGRERYAEAEAATLLKAGATSLGQPDLPAHVVLSASTSEGLRDLAVAEGADMIVFGSEYRTAIGLDPGLDFHSLRRSYVTHLIESGFDALFVQQQVGHVHASTTSLYTCVSSDYRTRTLRQALDKTLAGIAGVGQEA